MRDARALSLLTFGLCLCWSSLGVAQGETVEVAGGWRVTTRLRGLMDVNGVACNDDHAYARSWGGGVAVWDGSAWSELPEIPDARHGAYGTGLAVSPAGELFVQASGRIAAWKDGAWTMLTLPTGAGDSPGIAAPAAGELFVAGRGVIARRDGAVLRAYDAGTWRDLAAASGTSASDLWTAGQGGTLMHWDGHGWTRTTSGTEAWLGGLTAAGPSDVWAWSGEPRRYPPSSELLHWDGVAWSSVAPPPGATVVGVAVRGSRVFVATRAGIFERAASAWSPIPAPVDIGEIVSVCATASDLVVGAGRGRVLTHSIR